MGYNGQATTVAAQEGWYATPVVGDGKEKKKKKRKGSSTKAFAGAEDPAYELAPLDHTVNRAGEELYPAHAYNGAPPSSVQEKIRTQKPESQVPTSVGDDEGIYDFGGGTIAMPSAEQQLQKKVKDQNKK